MDFSRYDNIPYGPFLEEWKFIDGYDNRYQISNYGRFKSVNIKDKIRPPYLNDKGYLYTKLYKDKKDKTEYIHRLVALYFIPNPENKECVNHIKGIKTDVLFTQLEWVTKAENNLHNYRILGAITPNKGKIQIQKNSRPIIGINRTTGEIRRYVHCASVKKDGFSDKIVNACCTGKKPSHLNFIWKYDD